MAGDELERLRTASAGLDYPSESDAPFDLFCLTSEGGKTAEEQIAGLGGERNIEEVPLDRFFTGLEDSEDAPRFRQVHRALESVLDQPRVFRVGGGEVRVDIYLIGRTRTGRWAGLHTVSVET